MVEFLSTNGEIKTPEILACSEQKFQSQCMISIFLSFVVPRDCADVYNSGRYRNGIYTIDPDGEGSMEVFCDQVSVVVYSDSVLYFLLRL